MISLAWVVDMSNDMSTSAHTLVAFAGLVGVKPLRFILRARLRRGYLAAIIAIIIVSIIIIIVIVVVATK